MTLKEYKLVKFVKEGRDADMDRIMEDQSPNDQRIEGETIAVESNDGEANAAERNNDSNQ